MSPTSPLSRLERGVRFVRLAGWPLRRKLTAALLVPLLVALAVTAISLSVYRQNVPDADQGGGALNPLLLPLMAVLLPGLLLTALIAAALNTTIVRQIEQIGAGMSRIGRGDYAQPVPLVAVEDELSQLADSLNTLSGQLGRDFRNLEQRVTERTRDIEAARDIGQILSSIRDVNTLANQVITLICQRFADIYHAQVFLIDERGADAVLRASTGDAGRILLARGHRLAVGSQSVIGQVTARGEPMIALDTATSPIHKANELLPETRAECALPLRVGGISIGALDLQSRRPDAFSDADIRLLLTVADQLAIAIQNARLFEELQTRVREIEDLNRLLIGEAWQDYMSVRRRDRQMPGAPTLAHRDDAELTALQLTAIRENRVADQITGEVVRLAVPIVLRGQVLGAVEWELGRSGYNENTRLLATELAGQLALAADNARLLDQSQRLVQRERLINDIGSKLTQQTDVSQILRIAVRELGQALRVSQTSISVGDLSGGQARAEAAEANGARNVNYVSGDVETHVDQ